MSKEKNTMKKRIILHTKILVATSVFVLIYFVWYSCNKTTTLAKKYECHSLALENIKSTSYKYQVDHLFMKALKDDTSFRIPQNIKPFFFSFSDLGRNVCVDDINLSDISATIKKNQYNVFFANDFKAKMPQIDHKHVRFVFDRVKKQNENEIQIVTGYSTPFDIKRSFGTDIISDVKYYDDEVEKHGLFLFFQTDNDAVYSNRLKVACEVQSMNDTMVAFISKSFRSKKAKERLTCADGSEMVLDNRLNLNHTLKQLRISKCFWCPRGDVPTSDRIHLAFESSSIRLQLKSIDLKKYSGQ